MPAYIIVPYNRLRYRLRVEKIYQSSEICRFLVSGRTKSVTLQCNEPLLRGKGIMHRRPGWKVISGGQVLASFIEETTKQIEILLRNKAI